MTKHLLAIVLLVSTISCSKKIDSKAQYQTRYFSKLTGIISPFLPYQPRGELKEVELEGKNYYKVKYDEQGRIEKMHYFRKGVPNDNSYFYAHSVFYKYEDEKLTRTYFNKKNQKMDMWRHYYMGSGIHKEVFELDENGKKIGLALFDSLDNRIANGLGIYEYSVRHINDDEFIQRQFDKDGNPATLTEYFPFENAKIGVDQRGHLYNIDNVDENGRLQMQDSAGFAKVIFDFDEYGNEMAWRFYDTERNLSSRKPYGSMDYGYAQWLYKMDWVDQRLGLIKSYQQNYFDTSNQPVNDNIGIHQVTYEMNSFNDMLAIEYHNKNGEKAINSGSGYFRAEVQYDESGNRLSFVKYDTLGIKIEN